MSREYELVTREEELVAERDEMLRYFRTSITTLTAEVERLRGEVVETYDQRHLRLIVERDTALTRAEKAEAERDAARAAIAGVVSALDVYEAAHDKDLSAAAHEDAASDCIGAVESWVTPFAKPAFVGTADEAASYLANLGDVEGMR